MGMIIIVVTVGLFYALLIVPQRRQMRAHRSLVSTLQVGDEVITSAGLFGRITDLDDSVVFLEVAPGVEVRVARNSVGQLVPDELLEDGDGSDATNLEKRRDRDDRNNQND